VSLWYPFCAAQAAGLCDRLWIRPLWLPSEVWEPKGNLGTAVQKLVWKCSIKSCCRVRYVRDGCCLSCCCFMVLLDNIIITVSITYLLHVTVVKQYFGKHQMNRNCIQEKFNSTLQSENAWYHSVQNLLSSSLLSNNTKISIYRSTILPVVLRGCWTWSLTLCEEYRLV